MKLPRRQPGFGLLLALASWCLVARSAAADLPRGFTEEVLATNLNAVTAFAPLPDGRILIADQTGKLLLWREGRLLDPPALTLHVADYWERGLIGLALHPDFPRTPHLFVLYVTDRPFTHHVLSCFTLAGDTVNPASEVVLLEGDDQATLGGTVPAGHQGGPLRFGADGRLYIALGEQTAGEPSQRLDTLQGKVLRLNPDGSVPNDNPFLASTTGKYRAIFARGVRNPFGMALQPRAEGGRMFFTDVGGSAFEEVNELVSGANYGWPRAEGFSTNAEFKNPLFAYPPMVGQCIAGGTFCPKVTATNASSSAKPSDAVSDVWPEKWQGRFFFADFMKHWVKALDPANPTNVLTFARGFNAPVALEFTSDGSLLMLNRGTVWRDPNKFVANAGSLIRIRYVSLDTNAVPNLAPALPSRGSFPIALGLPADPRALPHQLNRTDWDQRLAAAAPRRCWVNGQEWIPSVKQWNAFVLPALGKLQTAPPANVVFPPGTVLVREFSVEAGGAKGSGGREPGWIETRVVVIGAPVGYGASYRWISSERAELVEDGELAEVGAPRPVRWWFPILDDALTFPTLNPSYYFPTALAEFRGSYPAGQADDLLAEWNRDGVFDPPLTSEQLAAGSGSVNWEENEGTAEQRVRSYFNGNCAVCHQPGGAARGNFDARITTPRPQSGLLHGELAAGDLGIPGARLVTPGDPEKSILYQRLNRTDLFRMPPAQYHNEISPIAPVVAEWIRSLKP
jgi:glucose/arabinose dehydrogenase